MSIDPSRFGLSKDAVVKFFTAEEAVKTPGAHAGFNRVVKVGSRVRYELLAASKQKDVVARAKPEPVPVATEAHAPTEDPVIVEEQPTEPVVEETEAPVAEEQAEPVKKSRKSKEA